MLGHGGSSAGSYLADPTSPIPLHCTVIILFQSVAVHQLSWLALYEVNIDYKILGKILPQRLANSLHKTVPEDEKYGVKGHVMYIVAYHTINRAAFVCLSVCLSVCFVPYLLRGPLTDLRQTWWVYVGGPRNCPWGVLFRKGQRLDGSTGHFRFPLYYICASLTPTQLQKATLLLLHLIRLKGTFCCIDGWWVYVGGSRLLDG